MCQPGVDEVKLVKKKLEIKVNDAPNIDIYIYVRLCVCARFDYAEQRALANTKPYCQH